MTVGDVVLFLSLMAQLYGPLNFFGTYYRRVLSANTLHIPFHAVHRDAWGAGHGDLHPRGLVEGGGMHEVVSTTQYTNLADIMSKRHVLHDLARGQRSTWCVHCRYASRASQGQHWTRGVVEQPWKPEHTHTYIIAHDKLPCTRIARI